MNRITDNCRRAIQGYQQLEVDLSRVLSRFCHDLCSDCGDCCKPDICEEAKESAWLQIVWNAAGNRISQFSRSKGWLSPKGCKLKAGRPPLCYEFFCNNVTDCFQEGSILKPIQSISKLPALVGKNAFRKKHLVTLSEDEVLHKLDFCRLENRIAASRKQFRQHVMALRRTLSFSRDSVTAD